MKNHTWTGFAALAVLAGGAQAQAIYLNEIYASHQGIDFYEFIELKGPANTSLNNYVVCVVEGEGTLANQGTLDGAWSLNGYTIPSDGHFVLGEPLVTPTPDFIIDLLGTGQDSLENGTETFYLINAGNPTNVAAILAAINTDIDSDNDNITTLSTLGTIVDRIGLIDCDALVVPASGILDHVMDGAPVSGPDGTCSPTPPHTTGFLPAGMFRGLDAPNGWCPDFLDFNQSANVHQPRTPGALNSVCPSAPVIINYCTAGTTTNNCNASMSYTGAASLALGPGGFLVNCTSVEGQKQGILFYGVAGQAMSPWGTSSSFLCVKAPTQRTGVASSGGTLNQCDGSLTLDFFLYTQNTPTALGVPFSPGNKAWFQGWFRDPPSPKSTMLSDGLEVTFTP